MLHVEFGGSDRLIPLLDDAVACSSWGDTACCVKDALKDLINEGSLQLPDKVQVAAPDHYGRHLLYRSAEHNYVVVSMAWGIGQATPVHDHAGVWCVEGVWRGKLEVTQYDLVERNDERYKFERQERFSAEPGDSGALIPPYEYHTLANALPEENTVTIHVYGRDLEECSVFEPMGNGWFERQRKALGYDN